MKTIPLAVATAVVAGTVLASPGAASAQTPRPGPSITVTDPAGDVLDADASTRFKARATDISRAVYSIKADRGTKKDKTDQLVTLRVEHRRSIFGKAGNPRQRLVVTFTSGGLRYRAASGAGFGLTYVDAEGRRQQAGDSFGGSYGGGRTELQFPADALAGDTLTDIRATLRVVGSRARDVVAPAPGPLQVGARD